MRSIKFWRVWILLAWLAAQVGVPGRAIAQPTEREPVVPAPVLKWANGGCYSSWCETGWYSSPAVADLDGDGQAEIIAAAYSIVVLDGQTGNLRWRIASGHDRSEPEAGSAGRTWPGVVVTDLTGDGDLEIVTAHGGGVVSVVSHDGYFEPGWPQKPTTSEFRGLSAADLDSDGDQEIIVTAATGSKTNIWIYEHTGVVRAGWPQLNNDKGYAWGVYNANAAVGNLDGSGLQEVVVPSDVHYILAYRASGATVPASPAYGGKSWGQVGAWESPETELRGWGSCDASDGRAERFRANFASGPALIADVNGDGYREVIVVGNMYDCIPGYPSQYLTAFLFNPDRSRFTAGGYDWRIPPLDTGAPLSEDYNQIESNQPNPAAADLDGDGRLEILFPSYDGRIHAFWLDKTEHGSWPYSIMQAGDGVIRFASEPTVADLDHDGQAEVLFTSWVQRDQVQSGKLHILNALGQVLHEQALPPAFGASSWNGGLAAPTLANIDGDPDLEVVVNTAHSGVVTYDLPGSAGARVLWATGRGNFGRTGTLPLTAPPPDLEEALFLPLIARKASP